MLVKWIIVAQKYGNMMGFHLSPSYRFPSIHPRWAAPSPGSTVDLESSPPESSCRASERMAAKPILEPSLGNLGFVIRMLGK